MSPPTYPEINNMLDKHGYKLPCLYIAQVKRKLGLIFGIIINKPWSKNSRLAPQVSAEKEAAILDSLLGL